MRTGFLGILIACLMSITNVAMADDAPANATVVPAKLAPGGPTNCAAKYYPVQAIRLNHEGAVVLAVHIDEKGAVAGVDIAQSSNWSELDDAAKQCVMSGWRFLPATTNGKPVASTKQYKIVWKLTDGFVRPHLVVSPTRNCLTVATEIDGVKTEAAILQYRVGTDGKVRQPFVAVSSNDHDFDQRALACVSSLVYSPFSDTSLADGVSWGAEILGNEQLLLVGDSLGVWHSCPDKIYPDSAATSDSTVVISFHVKANGQTINPAISQSSGSVAFDNAALECVKPWQHFDRLFIGQNLDFAMQARITFHLGHVYVLEMPAQQ